MYVFDDKPPAATIKEDSELLRKLARDLDRAKLGDHPSDRVLANAPVIDNWQLAYRQQICLVGNVNGHPEIKDGHLTRTSGVWLLSRKFGYARTLSRFYALGRPADDQYFRN